MAGSMLCGPGCLGCSYCDEGWGDGDRTGSLAGESARKRLEDSRRKAGDPTLHVSLGDILRLRGSGSLLPKPLKSGKKV